MRKIFTLFLGLVVLISWAFSAYPKTGQAAVIAQYTGGIVVYADGTTGTPKYKVFDDSTGFGSEQSATSVGSAAIEWIRVAASPVNDEWIIATRDADDDIDVQVCTGVDGGISCGSPTNITTSAGTHGFRNFDVSYEQSSGDALLVYGTSTADELRKIEWTGGSWTSDAAITTTRTSGTVEWVELTSRNSSDQIGIAYSDSADTVSAYRWSGSAVGNEATNDITRTGFAAATDVRKFDISFEGSSGDMLVAVPLAGAGTLSTGALSGSTWTIADGTTPDVITTFIDLQEPNPADNDIAMSAHNSLGALNLSEGYEWNGSGLTDANNGDDAAAGWTANKQLSAVAYLSTTYYAVAVLSSTVSGADDIEWWTMDSAGTITDRTVNTRSRGAVAFLDLFDYPNADKVLLITNDDNGDLWADTWDGAAVDGSAWTDLTSGGSLEDSIASTSTDVVDFAFRLAPAPTTTLGDGTDPSNSTVAPGSGVTDLGQFTFDTSSGTDDITAVTVTLSPTSSYENLSKVEITDESNVDECTDIDDPSSLTLNFTGCSLPATTSAPVFKIRITPKTHSSMPAVPGASYDITGTVTDWMGTNTEAGSDTDSATITVDNLSPSGATSVSGTEGDSNVSLNWTTSDSSDFSRSVVLRWPASSAGAEVPVEGTDYTAGDTIDDSSGAAATVACVRTGDAASTVLSDIIDGENGTDGCTTTALTNGQEYTYMVFQKDSNGNHDEGVSIGTFIPISQTLSFSISDNTIGFGALSNSAARYATGDAVGSASETEAHTLAVSTNASSGYTVTVQGATLTFGSFTIDAIGGTNTASSPGTEQFGVRASDTGTGFVSAPYAASGFAYAATASTASTLGTGPGDSSTTTYSLRYLANINVATEPGDYTATPNYVAIASF